MKPTIKIHVLNSTIFLPKCSVRAEGVRTRTNSVGEFYCLSSCYPARSSFLPGKALSVRADTGRDACNFQLRVLRCWGPVCCGCLAGLKQNSYLARNTVFYSCYCRSQLSSLQNCSDKNIFAGIKKVIFK